MEFPDRVLGWVDIAKGVGELVVDEAKVAFHSIFRMPHQLATHGSHFEEPTDALSEDARMANEGREY